MKKTTIGVIGIGNIRGGHLNAIAENSEYELIGVCRRSKDILEQIASELGCPGYTDYHDLLAQKPDVVLNSLPHGMHCDVTLEAFDAGCHVLVEKPMAVSAVECNKMLAAAREKNKNLLVTEGSSFTAGAILTGEKFLEGSLGRFFTGSFINERRYFHDERPAWFLDPVMGGGGMMSNVGLHRLATTRACVPTLTPSRVSGSVCFVSDYEAEACTSAMVKYEEGGSMLYEEVGYYKKPDWYHIGVHFVFEEGLVAWDETSWKIMTRSGKEFQEPLPQVPDAYVQIYANMLKAMKGEDYQPKAEGFAVDTAIVHAAYASSRENREVSLQEDEFKILLP